MTNLQRRIPIGQVSDIPKRGARRIEVNSHTIGVFRTINDEIHAIEDRCPHKSGPLSEGIVHGNCVTCPLHNWVINLQTGEATGADSGRVRVYPVETEGTSLFIFLSNSEATQARAEKQNGLTQRSYELA